MQEKGFYLPFHPDIIAKHHDEALVPVQQYTPFLKAKTDSDEAVFIH